MFRSSGSFGAVVAVISPLTSGVGVLNTRGGSDAAFS